VHDLVLFLDADNLLLDEALSSLLTAWRAANPPPALLASNYITIDRSSRPLSSAEPRTTGEIKQISARDLVIMNRFVTTVLADRKILISLGGFDTNLNACEDRELWICVAAGHRVLLFDHVTMLIRKHGSNMSAAASRQTKAIHRVLKKAFKSHEIQLTLGDRLRAISIYHYQSAIIFQEAGMNRVALLKMFRSLLVFPLINLDETVTDFARLKWLLKLLWLCCSGSN
jgi:hypothetical protein